jgi:hypothetical protein
MEDMQQEEVEVEQAEEEEGDGLPFADGGIEIAPEEEANSEDDEPLHRSDDEHNKDYAANGANDQDAGAGEHSQADDDSRFDEDAGSRSPSVGRSDAFDEGLGEDEEHDDGAALQEDYWRAREECFMRINEVRFLCCYDAITAALLFCSCCTVQHQHQDQDSLLITVSLWHATEQVREANALPPLELDSAVSTVADRHCR